MGLYLDGWQSSTFTDLDYLCILPRISNSPHAHAYHTRLPFDVSARSPAPRRLILALLSLCICTGSRHSMIVLYLPQPCNLTISVCHQLTFSVPLCPVLCCALLCAWTPPLNSALIPA